MNGKHVGIGALWLACVTVVAGAPAPLAASIPTEIAEPFAFDPPSGPMILSRTLRRPLPRGAEVMTRRSYEIRFRRDGDGFLIDGELVAVQASVPHGFEQLADIERQRRDADMFPMRLDRAGRLLPKQANSHSPASGPVDAAALERLGQMNLSEQDARDAAGFINRISHHPVRTIWPADLFNPEPGIRRDSQSVALPGGETGRVSILIDATRDGQTGLLATFRREVTTRLGTTERITQETWTLERKARP